MSKTKASVKFMKGFFEGKPILCVGYGDLSTVIEVSRRLEKIERLKKSKGV